MHGPTSWQCLCRLVGSLTWDMCRYRPSLEGMSELDRSGLPLQWRRMPKTLPCPWCRGQGGIETPTGWRRCEPCNGKGYNESPTFEEGIAEDPEEKCPKGIHPKGSISRQYLFATYLLLFTPRFFIYFSMETDV